MGVELTGEQIDRALAYAEGKRTEAKALETKANQLGSNHPDYQATFFAAVEADARAEGAAEIIVLLVPGAS